MPKYPCGFSEVSVSNIFGMIHPRQDPSTPLVPPSRPLVMRGDGYPCELHVARYSTRLIQFHLIDVSAWGDSGSQSVTALYDNIYNKMHFEPIYRLDYIVNITLSPCDTSPWFRRAQRQRTDIAITWDNRSCERKRRASYRVENLILLVAFHYSAAPPRQVKPRSPTRGHHGRERPSRTREWTLGLIRLTSVITLITSADSRLPKICCPHYSRASSSLCSSSGKSLRDRGLSVPWRAPSGSQELGAMTNPGPRRCRILVQLKQGERDETQTQAFKDKRPAPSSGLELNMWDPTFTDLIAICWISTMTFMLAVSILLGVNR